MVLLLFFSVEDGVVTRRHRLKYARHVPGHAYQDVRVVAGDLWVPLVLPPPDPPLPPTPQSQALVPLFFAHFNLCQIVAKMQNALCARRHLNPFRAFHYQLLPNVLILCAFFIFLFFPFVALLTQFCAFVFMCVSVKVCCFYFSLLWHNKNTAKQRGEMAKKRRVLEPGRL